MLRSWSLGMNNDATRWWVTGPDMLRTMGWRVREWEGSSASTLGAWIFPAVEADYCFLLGYFRRIGVMRWFTILECSPNHVDDIVFEF